MKRLPITLEVALSKVRNQHYYKLGKIYSDQFIYSIKPLSIINADDLAEHLLDCLREELAK